jgi:hypothetical protein
VPRLLARATEHPFLGRVREAIPTLRRAVRPRPRRCATGGQRRDGDTTARNVQALVATVSLGEPRRFLLKPADGGQSIAFALGRGDLIVMGGTCQRTWRHGIPKAASAGPRIAIMFRPSWARNYKTTIATR